MVSRIDAGKTVNMAVSFNSTGKIGEQSKSIMVFAAGHDQLIGQVYIAAHVKLRYRAEPVGFDFGTLYSGAKASGDVVVTRTDGRPLDARSAEGIHGAHASVTRIDNSSIRLSVDQQVSKDPGEHDETILLRLQDAQMPTMSIPVTYKVVGRYNIQPNALNFGFVKPRQSMRMDVCIVGPKLSDISILSVPAGMKVSLGKAGSQGLVLQSTFSPIIGPGQAQATSLVISTKNRQQPYIKIPVFCARS